MAETGIDPRYAAQFQRGFDPAVHAPGREPRVSAPIQAPAPPIVRRVTAAPPDVDPGLAVAPVEARAHVEATAHVESQEATPIARSPSEWALLGIGVVMLIVAGWLFNKSVEIAALYMGVGPSIEEQTLALAAETLPGPLVVAGFFSICLWIVLQAVRPRP